MSDDLVKRLRFGVALDEKGDVSWCNQESMFKAADRIEALEADLNTVIEDSDDTYGRLLERIEQLEAALRSIAANTCCDRCQEAALVARTALEGK